MTPEPQAPTLQPDAAQREQLAAVRASLGRFISGHGGWIGFDEYLEQVLYAPGLGYYSAGATKFGAAGDFITAPELSRLFGSCIARQCAPFLRESGAMLLELGAGSGALAEVLLARLEAQGALPERYLILETSAGLRARQRERLAQLPPRLRQRIEWLDALPPRPLRGVIFANEVADALPFQCFAAREGGFDEWGVALDGAGEPTWSARPAAGVLLSELERIDALMESKFPPGYRGEICLRAGPWIGALAAVLEQGCLLLFDYGLGRAELYHPERSAGTLRCHYRHRAHDDPFLFPGLQDISAWVDFTRLAEAAGDARLDVAGYCTQAAFLLGAGIDAELASAGDALMRAQLAAEARQLLLPGEMGETFKALLLTRGAVPAMPGFGVQDLRRLL
jgi:SAM-dependent MidA family methyltransferase